MKTILLLLISASIAFGSQTEPTKEELLQTVQHIQRLAKEQQKELDAAHENEKALQTDLANTQDELLKVDDKIKVLAQHDADETAAKVHILHKYHVLKGIAMAIATACAVFLVMRLTSVIPTVLAPYKIYLYAGAGALAAGAVAIFL